MIHDPLRAHFCFSYRSRLTPKDRRAVRHGKLARRRASRYRPFEIRAITVVSDDNETEWDRDMLPIALGDFAIRIKPEDS
jgi:hypothetical protein